MSKLTLSNESLRRSCFSTSSSENTRPRRVNDDDSTCTEKTMNSAENDGTSNEFLVLPSPSAKNDASLKYPLTERSRRDTAARIREARERRTERISKANETIARGAEVIKNHSKNTRNLKRIESLKKVTNNRCNVSERIIYDSKSPSFNDKIEALETNLKKLEGELIMGKYRFTNAAEDRSVATANNTNTATGVTAAINNKDEDIETNLSKSIESLCASNLSADFYSLQSETRARKMAPKKLQETRLVVNPSHVEFQEMQNTRNGNSTRTIKVINCSKNTVSCCYSHLFDPNGVLRGDMQIIKVIPVTWSRLQPGLSAVYAVTFKPVKLLNRVDYNCLKGVKLVFETAGNLQRPDHVKHEFGVPVVFCAAKPEPELVTKTISFLDERGSNGIVNPKKYLILKNNGYAECVFSVIKETEYNRMPAAHHDNITDEPISSNVYTDVTKHDENMFNNIVISLVRKMFTYFTWKNHVDVLLPAKGCVKVPIVFNRKMAFSTVSETYVIAFQNYSSGWSSPCQRVEIVGHVKDEILAEPSVIDAGLCYLASSAQVVSFCLHNKCRVTVPFKIKIPQELSKHVELRPSRGYLKAESSIDIIIRLRLKYDILQQGDCKTYLDADGGFLDFPVRVYPSDSRRYHEVHVLAVVATAHGLKLSSDVLDFGTVNTAETVVRSVALANHSRAAMAYGFLNLPEKVSILPSAFGTIFSGESVCLHIHYSPTAKDLPRKEHTFEDEFVLTCNTIAGLNADKFCYKVKTNASAQINENPKSEENRNYTNENDHELKTQIQCSSNMNVSVNSLDKNAILKEATVKCRAIIHDVPVELSFQKIVFTKTHFTSYSIFKIELRTSNLASIIERDYNSLPDFTIRFQFVSHDSSIEFKPKNGTLHSKEAIQICVIFRPKLDVELQSIYEECLNSELTKVGTEHILGDKNSFINLIYKDEPQFYEQIKTFEANRIFYSSMTDETKCFSAVCFVQFVHQRSIEYFGFDTESLKLSLVCPATKPNILLLSDHVDFDACVTDVRHDRWLLVRNATMHPVPLKISPPDPTGPFFCALAVEGGERSIFPGHAMPINVSFTPERETTENETLEIASGPTRLMVKLCGTGLRPTCEILPDNIYNVINNTHDEHLNSKFTFRVTNTCTGTDVRFNVELEWTKKLLEPLTRAEASAFAEKLRRAEHTDVQDFDGPDWTEPDGHDRDVFDLGNGERLLWFQLDPRDARHVQVTFRPPRRPASPDKDDHLSADETESNHENVDDDSYCCGAADGKSVVARRRCRVYAARLNVHVGRSVLRRFCVFGFAEDGGPQGEDYTGRSSH